MNKKKDDIILTSLLNKQKLLKPKRRILSAEIEMTSLYIPRWLLEQIDYCIKDRQNMDRDKLIIEAIHDKIEESIDEFER
jgi:hypothetical protein